MSNYNIIWRIDDRLIHGQILIGWCSQLPIKYLAVCDDEIASNEWEKNLLLMAAPLEIPSFVLSTKETAGKVTTWQERDEVAMVLLKSPAELEKLINENIEISKVNIGGIHFREDRREYLPYLFLSEEELKLLKKLIEQGLRFECQDLPTSPSYELTHLIKKRR